MSVVACGHKSNSEGEDYSSESSTVQSVNTTQNLREESIKTISPIIENIEEGKEEDEALQKDTQLDIEKSIQEEETEDEYYIIIKEAWQKQKDYIDSIDDPKVKQSVQSPNSAAIMESNRLLIDHPKDSEVIDESLKRVLNDE